MITDESRPLRRDFRCIALPYGIYLREPEVGGRMSAVFLLQSSRMISDLRPLTSDLWHKILASTIHE